MKHKYVCAYGLKKEKTIGFGHQVFTANGKLREAGLKELLGIISKQEKTNSIVILNIIEIRISMCERINEIKRNILHAILNCINGIERLMKIDENWYIKEGESNGSTKSKES